MCVDMQIFNFCDGHMTTFQSPAGPVRYRLFRGLYLPNVWSDSPD